MLKYRYTAARVRPSYTQRAGLVHETLYLLTYDERPATMKTTLFLPKGPGPFPLLVFNHGKRFGDIRLQGRCMPTVLARQLVKRGWAVAAPNRKGFADSGGRHLSHWSNALSAGLCCAREIEAAVDALAQDPRIDATRIVVAGHSYGALGTFAYGMNPHPGVRGLINFMGVFRSESPRDDWQTPLMKAFRYFGSDVRLPAQWFYGENDSFCTIQFARLLHETYQEKGARAEFVNVGRFRDDAHRLVFHRDGLHLWWPHAERFFTTSA